MPTEFKILGINDDQDTCQKCGKTHLKRVVWMVELTEDGEWAGDPIHVGTSCAAHLMFGDKKAATKNTVDVFAKWATIAQKWLDKGHSVADVLKGLRSQSGLAVDADGDTIRFWSREDRKVVAEVTKK